MNDRRDQDPAPRGWVLVDPTQQWGSGWEPDDGDDPGEAWDMADSDDEPFTHTPTPTYDTTRTTTYTLGCHTITTTTRVITTRKPEEAPK